ncbi:MAG: hypothetical protein IJR31_00235 [Lachnospiraceae bacterium]|nr:hypothetical protein [Lachnospiraceae bacterium]
MLEPQNNVRNLKPEEAKALLSGVVEMCIHEKRYDLSSHSKAWNFLAEHGAINMISPNH